MTNGHSRTWLWILVGGAAFTVFFLAVFTVVYLTVRSGSDTEYVSMGGSGGKIGVVKIEGVIMEPGETVRDLHKFAEDDSIKAIIVHLNTPGGGAAASEEIYREVLRIREQKKKPIVSAIETVGASGGYYVASATNKIYANDASIVGSIGVIAEWVNYGELLRWAKLSEVIVKAGEFKDVGSATRPMTPDEKAYFQTLIDNMHGQFIRAVATGRGVKEQEIRAIANGKVWTGEQGLALKLVDQIADFRSVVMETAKSVGIKGEPTLVRPEKQGYSLLDLVLGDASTFLPDRAKMLQQNPDFYFLWK